MQQKLLVDIATKTHYTGFNSEHHSIYSNAAPVSTAFSKLPVLPMIGSVLKAIDILRLFSAEEPRLGLAEISARLGLPKTTAHSLLNTLVTRHLVEKTDDGRYALGAEIIALTQAVRINIELRDLAAPLLRELSDACRESVYLAVLDGTFCLYIYAVESPRRLRARTAVGDRAHLHCTAVGKAMLSCLQPAEVARIVSQAGLPRFTAATITDGRQLQDELEQTHARGYALDRGEHEAGTYCVGAPIFSRRGQVIAACSVAGVDPAIVNGKLPDYSTHVLFTAQEISRYLGFLPARAAAVVAAPPVIGLAHDL
ncbi:MAG: IclR family transcriptional regulator [Chloroflexi bacterium]|nr:MAG: IclR family transcriptional regulator [Chloroflexota bacterium]